VLDVATGRGDFARTLAAGLASFDEIVGVDASKEAIVAARKSTEWPDIRFLEMDVEHLDLADDFFDTVAISAALHHLQDIPTVMEEVRRVLRPGGTFILAEMHSDGETKAQLTMIHLHHWVAAVDRALGIRHNATLPRAELVGFAKGITLEQVVCHDLFDRDSDPMEPQRVASLDALIDRTLARAVGARHQAKLVRQGEALRERLHRVGAQREPILLLTGVACEPVPG
jgi:2-polyprenyl-3-methyl-5-hydroxy-6-metoxy-1,4-benzoquinol methylase